MNHPRPDTTSGAFWIEPSLSVAVPKGTRREVATCLRDCASVLLGIGNLDGARLIRLIASKYA